MENVIRVKISHFAGTSLKAPSFSINETENHPEIHEDEQFACFTSGRLTARVLKR